MTIKKIVVAAIAGISMLAAFAGIGAAGQVDINVYGASAQYLYWNATAPQILGAAPLNCTAIAQATFNGKNGITMANCGTDNPVYIRVTSKASFDGIEALHGIANNTNDGGTTGASGDICSAGDLGDPGPATRAYYRKMVDESSCTWGTPAVPGSCTRLKCQPVTVAVSDVAGESFTQSSTGHLQGPLGGAVITRTFTGFTMPVAQFNSYNPIVVPFAFFANSTVKACPYGTPYNATCAQTISNLPRMMAVQIFSGQAYNWTDLGGEFQPSLPVVACFRHAGSGTHATLNFAVMNNGTWGANVESAESLGGPTAYFNDGSGDELNCVQGSGSWAGTGAIGYLDADQATSSTLVRLSYNGELPNRVNIRNGRYDFWAKEWMYEAKVPVGGPGYTTTHPYVQAMVNFSSKPDSIPTAGAWGPDKTGYWASVGEMNYMKTSDQTYPGFVGATNPVTP